MRRYRVKLDSVVTLADAALLARGELDRSLMRARWQIDSLTAEAATPIEMPELTNTQLAGQLNDLLQPYRERSNLALEESEVFGLEVAGVAGTFAPLSASGLYRHVLAVEVPRKDETIRLHEQAAAIEDSTRSAMRREINHLREAILMGSRVELGLEQTIDLQAESIGLLNERVAYLERVRRQQRAINVAERTLLIALIGKVVVDAVR